MRTFIIKSHYRHISLLLLTVLTFIPLSLSATPPPPHPAGDWVSLTAEQRAGQGLGRYFLKNGIVHVHVNGMISEELPGADPATFLANQKYGEFGRDKNHVWFISTEMAVDASSWDILSQGYSKDENRVYCGVRELPDADPKSFRVLREGLAEWGADKSFVFSQWFKLENSDPETFQFLDLPFSKDKNNVYYFHEPLDGADPSSFEIIKGNVGRDKNAVFAFGKKMPSYIDLPSVRVPGDGYVYDRNGRYHLYKGDWVKTER